MTGYAGIRCNKCAKIGKEEEVMRHASHASYALIRKALGTRGWTSRTSPNGKITDLCPECRLQLDPEKVQTLLTKHNLTP